MTAVLPLISPEKGAQLGFVAQGMMLAVSGVYYPVSVMPGWMQAIAKVSPATYALRGDRAAIVNGAGLAWADVWPLLVIAVFAIPVGLAVFKRGERYAKKHGRTLPNELQILILHGVLHLLGYDHETDNGQMTRVENRLRRKLGLQ